MSKSLTNRKLLYIHSGMLIQISRSNASYTEKSQFEFEHAQDLTVDGNCDQWQGFLGLGFG